MLAHFSKTWLLFTVWCLLSPALAHADAQDFSGTVGKIFDGDSFLVRPARGRDVDVRLQDIDAPEKTQPYGNAARAALVALIGGRSVFVDVIETDRYGRKVVRVYREPDRLDVIEALVREGHVWVYRRTVHDRSLIGWKRRRVRSVVACGRCRPPSACRRGGIDITSDTRPGGLRSSGSMSGWSARKRPRSVPA